MAKKVDAQKFGNEGGSVGRLNIMMSDRNGQKDKKKLKSHRGRREGFEKHLSRTQNKRLDSSSALIPYQHLIIKPTGVKLFAINTIILK